MQYFISAYCLIPKSSLYVLFLLIFVNFISQTEIDIKVSVFISQLHLLMCYI